MGLLQDVEHVWLKNLDPRVVDLPLIRSSYQVPLLIFAYLYFVLSYGPRFMKNRPPYSLKTFMKLYNIVQIIANVWLILENFNSGVFSSRLVCPVLNYSFDDIPMRLTRCIWWFFLLKILDYVETIIFVLRKKNSQISPLHLYHHVTTLFFTWLCVRYYAVGPAVFVLSINNFIHAIMYTYYLLAASGPSVQRIAALIKRFITIAQMIQFVVVILYILHQFILNCTRISNWISWVFVGNVAINFYMFYNFYQKTYKGSKKV